MSCSIKLDFLKNKHSKEMCEKLFCYSRANMKVEYFDWDVLVKTEYYCDRHSAGKMMCMTEDRILRDHMSRNRLRYRR